MIGGAALVAVIGAYPYYGSNAYVLSLLGKFLCYGIFALSIDLIWGFTGILSLGQAVYFGIGAYIVALSLKLNYALTHPTRFGGKIPDFMEWNSLTKVPGFMTPLYSLPLAIVAALVMPTLLAFLFGVITFKRHIYGVYCAVITLAESLILQNAIIEYQPYTGGFNGITDYSNYAGPHFLWFILAVTVIFLIIARLADPLARRHRAEIDKGQRPARRIHGLQRRQLSHFRILRLCFHGSCGRSDVCGVGWHHLVS